jgi:hypothetical protein
MREVCLLISRSGAVLWSDAGSSAAALPDSRDRWEAIWGHREQLAEVVHSHPVGPRAFSHEDETAIAALDAALGRPRRFSVLAPDGLVVRDGGRTFESAEQPWWAELLRLASGMTR